MVYVPSQMNVTIPTQVNSAFRERVSGLLNQKELGVAVTAALLAWMESEDPEKWIVEAQKARIKDRFPDAASSLAGSITPAVENRKGAAKKKPRSAQSTDVSPKQTTGRVKKK